MGSEKAEVSAFSVECEMVVGFKSTESGDPGDEIICDRKAIALNLDVPICAICLANLVHGDDQMATDIHPLSSEGVL